jgi:hypothetical protein
MSVIGGKQNDCLTKGDVMSANDTFLAIFLGSKTSAYDSLERPFRGGARARR